MPELETTSLPILPELETGGSTESETDDAPWGRKADGTPRKKPGRPSGSSGGSSTANRVASDTRLAERIAEEMIELSAPIGVLSPLAMLHVVERADRTSNALVTISKKHPAVKTAILAYFDSVAYKDIVLFVAGIPVAIMIDMGMLRPDAMVGRVWRMEDKWNELYGEDGTEFTRESESVGNARGLAANL